LILFNFLIKLRAGAVEQLRTHMRHLNALHPPERHRGRQMVQLYEKGSTLTVHWLLQIRHINFFM